MATFILQSITFLLARLDIFISLRVCKSPKIYLAGSCQNESLTAFARSLRLAGYEVFDDWKAIHPENDGAYLEYSKDRFLTYQEALDGKLATHSFQLDKYHIDTCHIFILLLPAGKSGHMELGYASKSGKMTLVVEPDDNRFDLMYKFADKVFNHRNECVEFLALKNLVY